jgi:hypothetical protein
MNSSSPSSFSHRTRGSAFIIVVIFTAMMTIMIGTLMAWSINERHLNGRNLYWLQASNAAEALAEYGMAQVANLYDINPAPTNSYFDPAGTTHLQLPNWVNSNTVTGNSFFKPNGAAKESYIDTNALSTTDPYGLELIATPPAFFGADTGTGTGGVLIDSGGNDDIIAAGNSVHDIENGKVVRRRDIQILAKATAVPTDGTPPITVCVQETISVRGDPLFANAIFYSNNDLEIAPSPTMNIYGPVRVNGNLFVSSQASTLNFHGSIFASGNIYHAWGSQNPSGDGSGSETLKNFPVNIDNQAGTAVNLITGTNTWDDSTMGADEALMASHGTFNGLYTNTSTGLLSFDTSGNPTGQLNTLITSANNTAFKSYLETNFGGLVQTGPTYSVQPYNPVGYTQQIAAPTISNPTGLPNPHSIIDPPSPPPSGTYYAANEAVEVGKLANKAGLYVKVTITPGSGTADTATISFYGPPGSGTGATTDGPNKLAGNGGAFLGGFTVNAAGAASTITGGGTEPSSLVKFVPYVKSGANVTSGIYDYHQQTGVDLVQLDMSALRAALTEINAAPGTPDANAIVTSGGGLWGNGANGWNGAIYVDVNQPGTNQAAVAMVNGGVANPSTAGMLPATNSTNPGGAANGLTVATAAPMYIVGDFNTDGKNAAAAASATTPEDGGTDASGHPSTEIPVALAADAITILSTTFFGTDTNTTNQGALPSEKLTAGSEAYSNTSNPTPSPDPIPTASAHTNTTSVSVAAAFLTGFVPTSGSTYSGGAHNLPHFLENWSGNTVNIRGSLVSLFSSNVAIKPYNNGTAYYTPPNRNWGFDVIFKNGKYPPQTPDTITFRRVFSNVISSGTYKSLRTAAASTPTGGIGASGGGYSESFVNF